MTKLPGMFWSGETLNQRLEKLIAPFEPGRIDCAAYTLAIGSEVYVSPNDQTADPTAITIRQLAQEEAFTIPPGQLAFLLTEEIVTVPPDALAFISIRAKIKFRGLVNVSGFHVDPGYRGQLTFAVFNAGPVPVHLKRGQPIFLIWYTSLDCDTAFRKNDTVRRGIDPETVTAIAGELQSFASLSEKINEVDKALRDRVHILEKEQSYYRVIGAIALAFVILLTTSWLKDAFSYSSTLAPTPTSIYQLPTLEFEMSNTLATSPSSSYGRRSGATISFERDLEPIGHNNIQMLRCLREANRCRRLSLAKRLPV